MHSDREHPLYHLDAETLLTATYIWVDDQLKALKAQGIRLPKKQKHQKATLAELLALAIFLLLQGQDPAKGFLSAKATLKAYFPSLPHLSRCYRVLQKAQGLLAHLLQVVDLKPLPLAQGHRMHSLDLPEAAVGVGPLGARVRTDVSDERARPLLPLCPPFWERPGNLGEGAGSRLPAVLGDRGFRWVQGIQTPPYRLRGGKVVETGWKDWMGKVRNWIETRFSVMVRSLGLHRIEARSYWGLVARVNLILLVHNLIRSRVLLKRNKGACSGSG
ncbi:hypothetical protein Mlute_00844 [Meiothermus luteus]|uniref:Transposase DDE domain protein n=1 Tax=Meiothermus luteus TaxID=2026184 RepID=A0A399ET29_9DEIN|nr:hypothetical protein Mlute_00844 [Meiothermus luteus]